MKPLAAIKTFLAEKLAVPFRRAIIDPCKVAIKKAAQHPFVLWRWPARAVVASVRGLRAGWNYIGHRTSNSTKAIVATLSIPGACVKLAIVAGAAGSFLNVAGPYLFGWMIASTTTILGFVARDVIKSHRRGVWVNAAGQHIESTLLERQELRHAQRRISHIFNRKSMHPDEKMRAVEKISAHFRKYAEKVQVVKDVPVGGGRFRFKAGGWRLL